MTTLSSDDDEVGPLPLDDDEAGPLSLDGRESSRARLGDLAKKSVIFWDVIEHM